MSVVRACIVLSVVLGLAGCARDLELPPAPGPVQPGTISGRVVFADPGSTVKKPAVGAGAEVLATGISAIADGDGRFLLTGVDRTQGQLLLRFGLKPDGTFARQRMLLLSAIGAGPGRDISLGDLSVLENAQVRGRVRRSDIVTAGGHGGTTVFVPEGPFAATSADDGSYLLPALPEGTLNLVFFRPGYLAVALEELTLRSGEELSVRDISLEVDPNPQLPAQLAGAVLTDPALADLSAGAVGLSTWSSAPLSAPLSPTGAFQFTALPAGVYAVAASHPGYTTASVSNFLVSSGGTYVLSPITLTTNPLPPQSDGGLASGPGDAGSLNGNLPPVANAGVNRVVRISSAATLHGEASLDPEGLPLLFTWTELSDAGVILSINNSLMAATPTFTAPQTPTLLRFRLTVTDNEDLSGDDEVVIEAAAPPVARLVPTSALLSAGESQTFSAAGSADPNGAPLTFAWTADPGLTLSATSGVSVTVTVNPGTPPGTVSSVRVIASNAFLSSDPAEAKVTVQ